MKANDLLDMIGNTDDGIIEEATIEMHYSRNWLNKSYSKEEINNMGIE